MSKKVKLIKKRGQTRRYPINYKKIKEKTKDEIFTLEKRIEILEYQMKKIRRIINIK